MYLYDTRNKNCKTLPLNGWLFPCTKCLDITGLFQTEKHYINWCRTIEVNIPLCYKCIKKYTLTIEDLDKNKIKYQSNE